MFGLVASRFAQVQSRRWARLYLVVLPFGAQLKNSWTIAEQAAAAAELLRLGRRPGAR